MGMALTPATARQQTEARIRDIVLLLNDGYKKRLRLAKTSQEFIPDMLEALKEQSVGIWVEMDVKTVKGEERKRVYQREPNPRAARLLLEMLNFFPQDHSVSLLNLTRAQRSIAEMQVGLPASQAQLTQAQAQLFTNQANVFNKALAEKSEIPPLVQSISAAIIGFLQHQGPEGLASAGRDYEAFQSFMERVVRVMDNALTKVLDAVGIEEEIVIEPEEEVTLSDDTVDSEEEGEEEDE